MSLTRGWALPFLGMIGTQPCPLITYPPWLLSLREAELMAVTEWGLQSREHVHSENSVPAPGLHSADVTVPFARVSVLACWCS